ncbi:hypothetical protein SPBRAN_1650 [uncultured Candidatus Thioglobus sp.]|nr:hypothetical protein SPBRAN_1650 [uncultured Candidatus Thioglobus sp.]
MIIHIYTKASIGISKIVYQNKLVFSFIFKEVNLNLQQYSISKQGFRAK